jgi:hypothetical protein
VNLETLETLIQKAVVFPDPHEFHSTWLGNKAVYRTGMVLANGAQLVILAPGVNKFGEDQTIGALIRKYGHRWNSCNDRSGECQCGSRRRSKRGCAPHSRIFGTAFHE